MKKSRLLIKLILLNAFLLISSFSLMACEKGSINISNCLTTQSWDIKNDSGKVKEICAGLPIDFSHNCSVGSLSTYGEVCIYEIVGGQETLVDCFDPSNYSFIPIEGKTYKIVLYDSSATPDIVTFTTVNCLDFEIEQNNDCEALHENKPIQFTIPNLDISSCYSAILDFGDENEKETYNSTLSHTYELNFSDPCETCQTFLVTASLSQKDWGDCGDCPELTYEKEVTVCRETEFYTGHGEGEIEQCFDSPCLDLGDYSNLAVNLPLCYYDGYSFEWTITDFNFETQTLSGLQQTICPAPPGTYTLTMTDPWGCTFTKSFNLYNSLPPETTLIEHILCSLDQEMDLSPPDDCQDVEYDPPYIMLPPYSSPHKIKCFDENGCLNHVYIHMPVYQIEQACMDDIEDLCVGDDLIVDGSCSDDHLYYKWEICDLNEGFPISLWSKTYPKNDIIDPSIAGIKNLSTESEICFQPGKCYSVKHSIGYICEGELHWTSTEKTFCVNPKPPCFGGPDKVLDPCVSDCVNIGFDTSVEYDPNLSHMWEDGTIGINRSVCPTQTTTYTLTTTNEHGCVCIDEVTVTVLENESIENTEFPICFTKSEIGEECELEVCLDIQINTGFKCDCAYSVTQLCQVIPYGEVFCFNLDQLDLPFGENYCASVIGTKFTLGGNVGYVQGSEYTNGVDLKGSKKPCDKYTDIIFSNLEGGTILLSPAFTVGNVSTEQNNLLGSENHTHAINDQNDLSKNRNDQILKSKILIFPNPVHSLLNIEMDEDIRNVQLFSINGKLAYQKELDMNRSKTHFIDVEQIPSGMYIIKVSTTNKIESRSIVISH